MAITVAKAPIDHGKGARRGLGVSLRDLPSELAKSVYVEMVKGALIVDVVKGGPAEEAGKKLH